MKESRKETQTTRLLLGAAQIKESRGNTMRKDKRG